MAMQIVPVLGLEPLVEVGGVCGLISGSGFCTDTVGSHWSEVNTTDETSRWGSLHLLEFLQGSGEASLASQECVDLFPCIPLH